MNQIGPHRHSWGALLHAHISVRYALTAFLKMKVLGSRSRRMVSFCLVIIGITDATGAFAQNKDPKLTLKVHNSEVSVPFTIELSGDIDLTADGTAGVVSQIEVSASQMAHPVVDVELRLVEQASGTLLASMPLLLSRPHKDFSRNVYFQPVPIKRNYEAIPILKRESDRSPSKAYFQSKDLYQNAQATLDRFLVVGAAYNWFKSNYNLATVGSQSDINGIDLAAVRALETIMRDMQPNADPNWEEWASAWIDVFGNNAASVDAVRGDIEKAKRSHWKLLRYVQYHYEEKNYIWACELSRYFDEQWRGYSNEQQSMVANDKKVTVPQLTKLLADLNGTACSRQQSR